jgi:micrococcal nuclease
MDYRYNALVEKVIDGDTIDVTIGLGFSIYYKQRLRLNGIDTKELSSPDPENRKKASEARLYVVEKILNKHVELVTYKEDKYGRYLADVYINDTLLNEELVDKQLAVYYDGGKR